MIKFIVGTIMLIALIGLILLIACTMNGINHVRCPKCGNDMDYMGEINEDGRLLWKCLDRYTYKELCNYNHYYKCPKCGEIKII